MCTRFLTGIGIKKYTMRALRALDCVKVDVCVMHGDGVGRGGRPRRFTPRWQRRPPRLPHLPRLPRP